LQQPENSDPLTLKTKNENAEPSSVMIRRVIRFSSPDDRLRLRYRSL
jgi:hypothetical protein